MKLLQELNNMNQAKPHKYKITFELNANAYNTPHYFDIPDGTDHDIEFKGSQCKDLQDEVMSLLKNPHYVEDLEKEGMGVKVLDIEIESVEFGIHEFMNNVESEADISGGGYGDDEDEEDEEDEISIETYADAMDHGHGSNMPYTITAIITTDGPVDHGDTGPAVADDKSALLHYVCDSMIGNCIWGQYADDGGGFRDFEVEEIQ
jgi:hypothetical protein